MKKHILLPLLLITFFANAQGPTQQWARAGGGVAPVPYSGTPPFESYLNDMAVDKWGNVYEVGSAFDELQFSGTSDTFPKYGAIGAYIVKYDKCGNYQWAILNGSAYGATLYNAIAIDSLGNIYVGGEGYADNTFPFHIQTSLTTDTLVYNAQIMYQKYDPNGNLLWQKYANYNWTVNNQSMKIRSDGKLLSILQCPFAGTWQAITPPVVSASSGNVPMIFAEFDAQTGNILQGTLIDTLLGAISNGVDIFPYVLDENDNIYLPIATYGLVGGSTPYPNAIFFGQSINIPADGAGILAKLDKNFNMIKYGIDDNSSTTIFLAYCQGSLYSAGPEFSYSNYMGDTVASLNSISGPNSCFRVYKLDTGTLAPIWHSSPTKISDPPLEMYITATSKHVYMSSSITGFIAWDQDTVSVPSNTQWQALFKFDNATGHCDSIYIDSNETSYSNGTTMITADAQENIFIGGQFGAQFGWGPNTLTTWGGAQSPIFFVEKWGIDCTDSLNTADNPYPPADLITTTQTAHSIGLNWNDNSPYRISFHIYRSPDGLSNWQIVDTALGSYTTLSDTGLTQNTWYWYKVAAWNAAGESDFTNIDSAKTLIDTTTTDSTTGIRNISPDSWSLYPNPAHDRLTLSAVCGQAQRVTVEIDDVAGSKVRIVQYDLAAGSNERSISIEDLPAGFYQVSMTVGGVKATKPVIKL